MKKLIIAGLALVFFALGGVGVAQAAEPSGQFAVGWITEIKDQRQEGDQLYQKLGVRLISGTEKGQEIEVETAANDLTVQYHRGQKLVISKSPGASGHEYHIYGPYRLGVAVVILLMFIGLVILVSGWKGVGALAGLAFSILVLVKVIVPGITAGLSPLMVCLLGSFAIAVVSLYLAHGFNRRTTIALISTLLVILLAVIVGILTVSVTQLFGMGSEEAFSLRFLPLGIPLDLRGILLGGMIIGTLGILDDVTVAQVCTVQEINRANTKLGLYELYQRGMNVGREHISSMINTLVLAYAGASFALFIAMSYRQSPLWVLLNNEAMMEEVMRAVVGSATLVLAVPISTFLGAMYCGCQPGKNRLNKIKRKK